MRIVTGIEGSWRTLRILDADPGQQTALAALGFGPDLVRRYPTGTRYFDRAVANLRQHLGEMVAQGITPGAPPGWAGPLEDLLCRAGQARAPVAVVGGAALAARGVNVRPGDIDVITTMDGVDALADSYQVSLVKNKPRNPCQDHSRPLVGEVATGWIRVGGGKSRGCRATPDGAGHSAHSINN